MTAVPDFPTDRNSADPELASIFDILLIIGKLPYTARVRVLNYIGARLNKDFD